MDDVFEVRVFVYVFKQGKCVLYSLATCFQSSSVRSSRLIHRSLADCGAMLRSAFRNKLF
eukprot:scaffold77468_cov33-Tisochrysis_lutea.AAC.4